MLKVLMIMFEIIEYIIESWIVEGKLLINTD